MSQKPTLPEHQKLRLKAHFGFDKVPFCKNLWVSEMFDSRSQRDAVAALRMWVEIRGIGTLTGPVGVGKSVATRRLVQALDETRYRVVLLPSVPATPHGFLRAINRVLGLPMRLHLTDLFDQAHAHLTSRSAEDGPHPVLVLDDAEGTSVENLDLLRRLTAYALDSEDRFSVLLSGTDDLSGSSGIRAWSRSARGSATPRRCARSGWRTRGATWCSTWRARAFARTCSRTTRFGACSTRPSASRVR
jgi:type II secretory pathway predicted ATPase ExeA